MPLSPRLRFGREQRVVGGESAEGPGPALGHEFAVDVAVGDPERAEQPAMLIAGISLDPHMPPADLAGERLTRLLTERLPELRCVDADEANLPGPPLGIDAGDGVTVVDRLHPPQRPTRVVEPGAHRHDDRRHGRRNRSDDQVRRPQPWGQARRGGW